MPTRVAVTRIATIGAHFCGVAVAHRAMLLRCNGSCSEWMQLYALLILQDPYWIDTGNAAARALQAGQMPACCSSQFVATSLLVRALLCRAVGVPAVLLWMHVQESCGPSSGNSNR